jgi:hypothetical protein
MRRIGTILAGLAVLIGSAIAAPASAQIFFFPPEHEGEPVTGAEPGLFTPALSGGQPAEIQANLVWNLRSSLNVAALNCQFWPTVMSVDNYNAILSHHRAELSGAYEGLRTYFRRTAGRSWQSAMDEYTTSMYQGYIRIGSQRSFCTAAAETARDALARPKGQLHLTAQNRMRQVRNSLVSYADATMPYHQPVPVPPLLWLDERCWRNGTYNTRRC